MGKTEEIRKHVRSPRARSYTKIIAEQSNK